eukprot:1588567-Rhodomonas_salina.2
MAAWARRACRATLATLDNPALRRPPYYRQQQKTERGHLGLFMRLCGIDIAAFLQDGLVGVPGLSLRRQT